MFVRWKSLAYLIDHLCSFIHHISIMEKNLLMMVATLVNKRWMWEGGWQIKVFETLSNEDPTILWLEH
jgi:hypothetical protein